MNLNLFSLRLLCIFFLRFGNSNSETITYISTEHPSVEWYDTQYLKNVTLTSRRISRQDPRYFVEIYGITRIPVDNHIKVHFYFYQFLTNRYRPSFVETHFKACDMLDSDKFFGPTLRRVLGNRKCPLRPVTYLSVEHPEVTYYNPKFLAYANLTSVRYGRANPIYYVGLNFDPIVPFDSSIYVDIYFYELLSNQYKRSFIEFHFTWCYLTEKDMFFGYTMRAAGLTKPCPHGPGPIYLQNMTINPKFIPKGFPFTKGRIYANFTHPKSQARVADGYIDMRLSTIDRKNAKSLFEH